MDISVVIPTRNRSRLLALTLSSVLRQRGVDLEVIIVDEASTDDTPAVVTALSDSRIRLIRHDVPRGVSGARNHGLDEARGEWLAFLDDDDLWAPDKLSRQLEAARAGGNDWVYAGSVNINDRLEVIHGVPPLPPAEVVAALSHYNTIPGGGSNVMARRATVLQVGPFDTRLYNTEDWEMWLRLSRKTQPAWVCSPLVAYRTHTSMSSLNVSQIVRGVRLIEQIHNTRADWGQFYRWIAQVSVRKGRRADALRYFGRAALTGKMSEVRSDLSALIRAALHRQLGDRIALAPRRSDVAWEGEARTWLEELRCLEVGVGHDSSLGHHPNQKSK